MNFIKRALLSTKAKKGRTILLICIFSAILIFVLAGLTIRSAALSATESAKKSMGATITLSTNKEASFSKSTQQSTDSSATDSSVDPGSYSVTPVPLEDATAIAKLDNIKSYNFLSSTSAGATDSITPISSSDSTSSSTEESSSQSQQGMPSGGDQDSNSFGAGNAQGDFSISGVLTTAAADDFSDGTSKIVEGVGITAADVDSNNVVIEETLAEANDLSVGDTFTISNPTDETVTYDVTIVGIYSSSSSSDSLGMNFNFLNPSNTIYTSYTFANTLKGDDYTGTIDSATYELSDPETMSAFVKKAKKLIDTDSFSLQTNDQAYQQMIEPLDNVASFAKNIVVLVTIAGIIILSLIVMMSIRERKYEIGVLLSIGESRVKVIGQFFIEMFLIMFVSLIIASFSGRFVGNIVGQQLLDQQTTESTSTSSSNNQNGGGPSGQGQGGGRGVSSIVSSKTTEEVASLNITLSIKEIVQLGGFGFAICLLSVLLSSIGILRLQPKKILTS